MAGQIGSTKNWWCNRFELVTGSAMYVNWFNLLWHDRLWEELVICPVICELDEVDQFFNKYKKWHHFSFENIKTQCSLFVLFIQFNQFVLEWNTHWALTKRKKHPHSPDFPLFVIKLFNLLHCCCLLFHWSLALFIIVMPYYGTTTKASFNIGYWRHFTSVNDRRRLRRSEKLWPYQRRLERTIVESAEFYIGHVDMPALECNVVYDSPANATVLESIRF